MACGVGVMTFIPAIAERLYHDIATPKTLQPKPTHVVAAAVSIALTKDDATAIIQRKRTASPEELQYLLDHAKELQIDTWARDQLGVDLTVLMASKRRGGFRNDPAAQFMSQTLGLVDTPRGLIERAWVHEQMRAGAQAIARCKLHRPPSCQCWSASRATLWQAQATPNSPEAWVAERIYSFLEQLELASRPERQSPVQNTEYAEEHQTDHYFDLPSRSRWPTRTESQQ
jgi:hypothetical protein